MFQQFVELQFLELQSKFRKLPAVAKLFEFQFFQQQLGSDGLSAVSNDTDNFELSI